MADQLSFSLRQILLRRFTVNQQKLFNAGNQRLLSMPYSTKWLLVRSYYLFCISLFDITINFVGQSNLSLFITFSTLIAVGYVVVMFKISFMFILLALPALFFLGNFISYRVDFSAFLFTASAFLSSFEIALLLSISLIHFTKQVLAMLTAMLFFTNLGFLVISNFFIVFLGKIFNFGVKKWRKKVN